MLIKQTLPSKLKRQPQAQRRTSQRVRRKRWKQRRKKWELTLKYRRQRQDQRQKPGDLMVRKKTLIKMLRENSTFCRKAKPRTHFGCDYRPLSDRPRYARSEPCLGAGGAGRKSPMPRRVGPVRTV